MKSGMQLMLESMLGADGLKAVEECKRILPAVPTLIENIKRDWEAHRKETQEIDKKLELVLSKLEALEMKLDPNKTEELPPSLRGEIGDSGEMLTTVVSQIGEQGAALCPECGALFCEHRWKSTSTQ